MAEINFSKIERKWQNAWEKKKAFKAVEKNGKKKFYVLEMYPYPSASGLHMGHAFNYTVGDIYARFKRMQGFNVLYPMGYDSFGLPAENAAIKAGEHPKKFTEKAIKNFIKQQKELGLSYDWDRMLYSHDPEYYKWNQWIFLKMLEKGLAYRKKANVNWCEKCQSVLANEQVHNGCCWRHKDTEVEIKQLEQWFLETTRYADELLEDIEKLDWPNRIKIMQENWIGKSEGTEIDFEIGEKQSIQVKNVKDFREKININSRLMIKGKEFSIREIVKFRFDDGDYYLKLFLDEGYVLADDFKENSFILVKEVKDNLIIKKDNLDFKDKNFNFIYSAHAVAEEVQGEKIFGKGEGETFWDYKSKDGSYLSLGIVDNIKKRLDFLGEIVYSKDIQILKENEKWPVFTTRADTLFGVTFLVISAQHPRLMEIVSDKQKKEVEKFVKKIRSTKQEDMDKLDKEGVFTGTYAEHPLTGEKIPVWAGNFVVADYGSGIVMAVPAHDQRDFEFAKKYGIDIKQVIAPLFQTKEGPDAIREDKETIDRNSVFAIVKHWKDDKYLCLDWEKFGWHSVVIGGIEENEDPKAAAIREVKEETGYQDIKKITPIGFENHGNYFATHKGFNRYARFKNFLIELGSGKYVVPDEKHSKNHKVVWLDKKDVKKYLNLASVDYVWDIYLNGEKAYTGAGKLINSGDFNELHWDEGKEHITKALEAKKLGRKKIQYKLRDWLISRQRYWGTPIPIIYCDDCGIVAVKEKDLPVLLPEKVKFGKGNPLLTSEKFVNAKCPTCGSKARRETDTMDTFFDSSWYYLRFCDSKNKKKLFDFEKAKYWMNVDQYIGGAEHATMHLIYARFFYKFFRDLRLVKGDEPFKRLFNQGMLHGNDGVVMSKSRGNVVLPEVVSKKYGIDTARLFLVSVASPDKDTQWNDNGVEGSLKFIRRVFDYFEDVKTGESSKKLEHEVNKAMKGITENIENMGYNFAVIKLRSLFDFMEKEKEINRRDLESFVKLLSVFAPHIAEEFWSKIKGKGFVSLADWPKYDEKKIDEKFDKAEEALDKLIGDVQNILKIVKEKSGKEGKKVYLYVIPNEAGSYNAFELGEKLGVEFTVYAVNDKKKYDPDGKAGKAKPGKPGIFVE